jgi:hypothetical protein
MTQPVTAELEVAIGRVVHDLEPKSTDKRDRLASPQREDGALHTAPAGTFCPHASQPVQPGTSQQVEQERLGLVVSRVPDHHPFRQHFIASGARSGLKVPAGAHSHRDPLESRAKSTSSSLHDSGLVAAPGTKAVVHVHSMRLAPAGNR